MNVHMWLGTTHMFKYARVHTSSRYMHACAHSACRYMDVHIQTCVCAHMLGCMHLCLHICSQAIVGLPAVLAVSLKLVFWGLRLLT